MTRYLKRDSEKGFVEDYVEIQALKFNNIRHVVLDGMLGDFDDQGNYIIHQDIVKELVEMPKYIVEVMDNLEVCFSTLKLDKQISFLIAYEGERATLSLLEKVNYEANGKIGVGAWSNVNEYILDMVETSGEIDRQALYLRWNVQTFAGDVIDIFNCEESVLAKYFNIVNRFKLNIESKTELLKQEEKLEENEAEYFLDLMEILQAYPELNTIIKKELKQLLTERKDFVKLDKPYFMKTLNEVVNNTIEANVNVLQPNAKENFLLQKRNITLKKNVKDYDVVQFETNKLEDNQVRTENLASDKLAENNGDRTITRLQTDSVKFKPLKDIVDDYVKTEKAINEKKKSGAISLLIDKPEENKTGKEDAGLNNRIKKIFKIIKDEIGVEASTIISAPILDSVKDKGNKNIPAKTNETDITKAPANAQAKNQPKPETKNSTKKPTKTAGGKNTTKAAGGKNTTKTASGNNTNAKKKNTNNAQKKQTGSAISGGGVSFIKGMINGGISRRVGSVEQTPDKNKGREHGLEISNDRLNYVKNFARNKDTDIKEVEIQAADETNKVTAIQKTNGVNKTSAVLVAETHIIADNKTKTKQVTKTSVVINSKFDLKNNTDELNRSL